MAEVVNKFVMFANMSEFSAGIAEEARTHQKDKLPCREPGCSKSFIYPKARVNHENKVHGLVMAPVPAAEPLPCSINDHKKGHTEARLSFGFLLSNFLDAVKEGDGERLMRLYKVALLIYKAYGHTQYAYSTFLLTVQVNATLSPRLAHNLTWNRFWNGKGGKGRNIPLDLHLEHLNNFLKSFLKNKGPNLTEETADRVSRSVGVLKVMMDTTDKELQVSRTSGSHHPANLKEDVLALVEVFRETEVFKNQPGRHFLAFPDFERNILFRLKYTDLWQWMRSKLKDLRAVPI